MEDQSPVIFLDRDGTIIENKHYLNDPNQIRYLPGVISGLRKLRDAGFRFIVVTNQSGIARGLVQIENLYEIHRRLRADLHQQGIDISAFYYAPYLPSSHHPFRKPNPGMIELAFRQFSILRSQSWMIGDSDADLWAGLRAGIKSIWLHSEPDPNLPNDPLAFTAHSFAEAARLILSHPPES